MKKLFSCFKKWLGNLIVKHLLSLLHEELEKGTIGSGSEDLPVDDANITELYAKINICSDLTKDMTSELDAWDLIKQYRPWLCHRLLHGLGPR